MPPDLRLYLVWFETFIQTKPDALPTSAAKANSPILGRIGRTSAQAPSQPDAKPAMDKGQLISTIRNHNESFSVAFLERFSVKELEAFLSRLESAKRKDMLIAGWVRPKSRMRIAS